MKFTYQNKEQQPDSNSFSDFELKELLSVQVTVIQTFGTQIVSNQGWSPMRSLSKELLFHVRWCLYMYSLVLCGF